jgi:hypothetical protein
MLAGPYDVGYHKGVGLVTHAEDVVRVDEPEPAVS